MTDTVYYSDGSLQVTEQEIILPERTYQLVDVKSTSLASARIIPKEWERWQFLFYWLLFSLARSSSENPDIWRFDIPLGEAGRSVHIGSGYFFLLLIIAVRAFLAYRGFFQTAVHVHIAKVAGSFGKVAIAAATRRDQMQKLLDAVNAAIIRDSWGRDKLSEEMGAKPKVVPYTQEASGEVRRMVWVDGRTYNTSGIKSVEKTSTPAHPHVYLINLVADVATLCIFIALAWTRAVPKDSFFISLLALLLLSAPGFLSSVFMSKSHWPVVYLAKLKTDTGTQYVFASLDEDRVREVVDYISISLPYGPKSGYITDSDVQVDDARARFHKREFAIGDINAVKVEVIRERNRKQESMSLTAFIASIGMIALGYSVANDGGYWLMGSGAILLLPAIGLLIMSSRTVYTLTLQGRFGEVQAYSSHSKLYIRKIATILGGVLLQRRETLETPHS